MFLPGARKHPQGARHLKSRIVPSWRHIRAGHADLRRWSRMNRGAVIRVGLSFHVLALPFRQNAERHDVALSQAHADHRHRAIIADAIWSVANNLLVAIPSMCLRLADTSFACPRARNFATDKSAIPPRPVHLRIACRVK